MGEPNVLGRKTAIPTGTDEFIPFTNRTSNREYPGKVPVSAAGTVAAGGVVVADANKDVVGFRNVAITGALTVGATIISETDLQALDGVIATPAEINRAADVSTRIVPVTTSPLAVVETTHEGKTVVLTLATGIAVTLPAATGGGAKYRFIIGATVSTTSTYTFDVTGNDTMVGFMLADDGDGEPANGWTTVVGGSATNKVTLGGSSSASGGTLGDLVEFQDIAADLWHVAIYGTQGGTEVTPFSHV